MIFICFPILAHQHPWLAIDSTCLRRKDLSHAASSIRKFRAKQQLRKAAGVVIAMQRMAGISWKTPSSDKNDRTAEANDGGVWTAGVSARSDAAGVFEPFAGRSVVGNMPSSVDASPGASPAARNIVTPPHRHSPTNVGVAVRLKSQRAIKIDTDRIDEVVIEEDEDEAAAPF